MIGLCLVLNTNCVCRVLCTPVSPTVLGGEKGYVIIMSLEKSFRAHELCESRGGRPGLLSPNKPTVSVDVKPHFNNEDVLPVQSYIPSIYSHAR